MPPWAWMPRISSTITARANDGLRVLGLRFTNDRGCPGERFETLRATLGASFEGIEIDSSPGNAAGIAPSAHAVLTVSLVDEPGHPTRVALDRVLALPGRAAASLTPSRRDGRRRPAQGRVHRRRAGPRKGAVEPGALSC